MTEKETKGKNASYDLMQDTQYLLMGLDESESESYALEDILSEFGNEESLPVQEELPRRSEKETPREEPQKEPVPETQNLHPNVIAFPGTFVGPEKSCSDDTMVLIDMREYEEEPENDASIEPEKSIHKERSSSCGSEEEKHEEPTLPRPMTMEDIVASTVDAVKAEQDQRLHKQRRRLEKVRKKREKKSRAPRSVPVLKEVEAEPDPKEAAVFHKRRWYSSRRALLFAVPVWILMWLPWVLEQFGIAVPYFGESLKNTALCVLIPHTLLCILSWDVFRTAAEELKELRCTCYLYTVLTNLAALLDTAMIPRLPERTPFAPLGCVAGTAMVCALWGLKCYHRGMWETLRTASMGEPACVADRCEAGIARGHCRREGFVQRANMESSAAHWQRLVLPVLLIACVAFAQLSSVGQGNDQDFLWCWSVTMCASCSLVFPMTYCVPLGRVARRLGKGGTAIAGQYGATVLAADAKIVVIDTDLFPHNTVSLDGVRLYGEEEHRAISYTATLAIRGGGCMGRLFEEICREKHINCQPLEHFHVHDDCGLSGMIRGETILVGTPLFMRHKAVRLPSRLPARTAVCLAVDGELTAIFAIKYRTITPVEIAMRALSRNGMQLLLATRDGNITAKRLKQSFGADGKATFPEISDRLTLSDPRRDAAAPNGLLYRDGILPFVELVALSRKLCQMIRVGNFLSILGSVVGALLSYYLTFVGRGDALTPGMLMVYLLLWTVPMLPLLVGVDKM